MAVNRRDHNETTLPQISASGQTNGLIEAATTSPHMCLLLLPEGRHLLQFEFRIEPKKVASD
jgi:hypothetical protein